MNTVRLEIKNRKGLKLQAYLELPANQKPNHFAIFAHCFSCNSNFNAVKNISRSLSNHGFGVLRFDFTGLGKSEGEFAESHFSANVDDGSCLYDAGCFGEPENPYWLNDECYAWVITVDSYCCTYEWDNYCQIQYDYCGEEYSVGLDDLEESEILFYPNPTTGIVNILAKNDIKIDVTNILGETIAIIENENRIDLSHFSNGIYIFNITYNNSTIQYKIIKK